MPFIYEAQIELRLSGCLKDCNFCYPDEWVNKNMFACGWCKKINKIPDQAVKLRFYDVMAVFIWYRYL